jgi:beta-galactosidase
VQYQFAAPNGNYSVTLKFSENWFLLPGQRLFNIVINGRQVETGFDILAAAGGPFTAADKTYATAVSNGQVVIQLVPVVQNAKIDALSIVQN